jgi:hypothetical protein
MKANNTVVLTGVIESIGKLETLNMSGGARVEFDLLMASAETKAEARNKMRVPCTARDTMARRVRTLAGKSGSVTLLGWIEIGSAGNFYIVAESICQHDDYADIMDSVPEKKKKILNTSAISSQVI